MSDNKELEMLQDGTKVSPETDDMGSIHVDDEVLSIVAGLAASGSTRCVRHEWRDPRRNQ